MRLLCTCLSFAASQARGRSGQRCRTRRDDLAVRELALNLEPTSRIHKSHCRCTMYRVFLLARKRCAVLFWPEATKLRATVGELVQIHPAPWIGVWAFVASPLRPAFCFAPPLVTERNSTTRTVQFLPCPPPSCSPPPLLPVHPIGSAAVFGRRWFFSEAEIGARALVWGPSCSSFLRSFSFISLSLPSSYGYCVAFGSTVAVAVSHGPLPCPRPQQCRLRGVVFSSARVRRPTAAGPRRRPDLLPAAGGLGARRSRWLSLG